LELIVRMGTLVLTALAAVAATSLAPLQHHPSRAARPAHVVSVPLRILALSGPAEPGGRVTLWQNQKLLAAEAPPPAPPSPPPAPAPAPKPPPPARPPAPAPPPNYGTGTIQDIITKAFAPYGPGAVSWGLRVAQCESGFNPRAYNPAGPYMGLFQFLMSTFRATPSGSGDIYDPVANANAAAWKFANGGASAWGCR
jgi:transglycosylase-like protein with SLT domain